MIGIYLGDKPTKTTAVVNADEIPLLDSQDLSSGRKKVKKVTAANLKASILAEQPKVLLMMLQQAGAAAPVETIVKDDVGIAFQWVYGGAGDYQCNFDSNISDSFSKIAVYFTPDSGCSYAVSKNELNQIIIATFDTNGEPFDPSMVSATFKIEVYP